MAARFRGTRNIGTPFLLRCDLPGTSFLLQAEGKDGKYAPAQHARYNIDEARRSYLRQGPAFATPGASLLGVPVAAYSSPAAQIDARDFLARLLARLTPGEVEIAALVVDGQTMREIASTLGRPRSSVHRVWQGVQAKARALDNGGTLIARKQP